MSRRRRCAVAEPGGLAGHLDGFVRAVREAGIPVGISQAVDAAEILTVVDLLDREQLRHGLAAVLLQRAAQRPTYDVLFDLWWPLDRPSGARRRRRRRRGRRRRRSRPLDGPARATPDLPRLMRAELLRLLLDGRRGGAAPLRPAGRRRGSARGQPSPSGQSFFSYRVLRALSPDTLVAQLLAGLLGRQRARRAGRAGGPADGRRSGSPPSGPRSRPRCGAGRRRRRAGTRSRSAPSGRWPTRSTSCAPSVDDLAELRRTVAPLARRLAVRLSARRRLGREGRLDFRRTVRASLGTGGVPVVTHHRPRKVHKPELVVLCDVSGSVAGFSHFTLMLTQALREHFTGVRAFAFVDTTDEVTRFFAAGCRRGRRGGPDRPGGRRRRLRRAQRLRERVRGVRRRVGRPRSGRRPRCWCSATAAPTTASPACRCSGLVDGPGTRTG